MAISETLDMADMGVYQESLVFPVQNESKNAPMGYFLLNNFLNFLYKIDGQARGLTFKVYFLIFMNVHIHTQLQMFNVKFFQKSAKRNTVKAISWQA